MSMTHLSDGSTEGSTETHLPGWAYSTLALATGAAGVAAAAITARFFILGMERLEPDLAARQALTAVGILMIAVELLAFGAAALLPRKAMRAMRFKLMALGFCLLAFEAGTLYVTQVAMVRVGQAVAQGETTRIAALRASIASQRQAAATLRATAERQAESRNEWVRNVAAKQAGQALAVEADINRQAAELAELEAASRPTLDSVLGDQGMALYALFRSLLIVIMSVVLLAVSGGLLRARYALASKYDEERRELNQLAECVSKTNRPSAQEREVAHAQIAYPWPPTTATTAAENEIAVHDDAVAETIEPSAEQGHAPGRTAVTTMHRPDALEPAASDAMKRSAQQDSGIGEDDGTRYQRVRADILAGILRPSLRPIYEVHGATQEVAKRYLAAMEAQGELQRQGKGYVLSSA